MRSILDGVTLGTVCQAEVHAPAIVKGDLQLEQEVCVTIGYALVQMHITDWANVEHSIGLAEGTEEDRFEGISGRTHLQQRRPADLT